MGHPVDLYEITLYKVMVLELWQKYYDRMDHKHIEDINRSFLPLQGALVLQVQFLQY